MSAEVLNDQIWTSPQVEGAFPDRSRRMSVNGVIAKSMLLLMIVIALAVVMALSGLNPLVLIPATVILFREVFVSGLREFLEQDVSVVEDFDFFDNELL